jgi:hypothetical protein
LSGDNLSAGAKRRAAGKPTKPYPDFPLSPRVDGRSCKKIRGKVYTFGKVLKAVRK